MPTSRRTNDAQADLHCSHTTKRRQDDDQPGVDLGAGGGERDVCFGVGEGKNEEEKGRSVICPFLYLTNGERAKPALRDPFVATYACTPTHYRLDRGGGSVIDWRPILEFCRKEACVL